MKQLIKNIYGALYGEELTPDCLISVQEPLPTPIKSNREKLYEHALTFYNTDPTPLDVQPDEFACVESLTTILSTLIPFPILTYTPKLLAYLQSDKRFKATSEFKKGNIIVSPTLTGNGTIVGHTGVIGEEGKILSNSSSTGLWSDKFDLVSWVERYSRKGGLSIHIFELV